jgi:hypothetical protein
MNDLIDGLEGRKPVAMSWIYTTVAYFRCGMYQLSHAKSADFQKVLP